MDRLGYINEKTAVLIHTSVNRRYLTSFASSLGYLVATNRGNTLFVDGRYIESARSKVKDADVILMDNVFEQINGLLASVGAEKLLIETENDIAFLATLKKKLKVKVVPSSRLSEKLKALRSIKSREEINSVKSAQAIAERAFDDILNFIRAGVTEKELAALLEYKMKSYGAEGIAFETIAVSGKNSSMPHGVSTDKVVEAGDFVTMDFGAVINGYCSDMTRTVAIGFATDEMRSVYDTVLKANEAVIAGAKAGLYCSGVDAMARQVIDEAGYGKYFTHSTGHGVGLEIHEMPTLSPKANQTKLRVGQLVTDEPGIYIEGKFGVRIEDMLLIQKNGCKNLTKAPKHLIIL